MNCNYKVKITDIQNKYQFKILCKGGANSTNVNDIYNLLPTTTNENTDITISNTADIKAKSITIKGNTSQAGTPTPTSPVDVKVVTGTNTIKIQNKNIALINKTFPYTDRAVTYSYSNNQFNLSGTANNNNIYMMIYEPTGTPLYKSGDVITVMNETNWGDSARIEFLKSNSSFSVGVTKNATQTLTLSEDVYGYRVWYSASNNKNFNGIYQKIEIEKGTPTPTDYVEHQEKNYTINLGTLELCKIGTYQDYLYKNNNKWYKHQVIGEKVLVGTENWSKGSDTSSNYYILQNIINANQNYADGLSNYFVNAKAYPSGNPGRYAIRDSGTSLMFNSSETTTDNFKTWLTTHNTLVYYPLATATDIEITDTTLIKQLNNITNNIRTFEGGTNISSTSAGANPIINITTFNKLS